MKVLYVDFAVVGAGIVGVAIARELKRRHPGASIAVFDKEKSPGLHGSGRNSGVLHSGIYYPEQSLKAKMCADGARLMGEYCDVHGLPIRRLGKVIVPTRPEEQGMLEILMQRGRANGADVAMLDAQQLHDIEPDVRSATGMALHSPRTAVVDPKSILLHMVGRLAEEGVRFCFGAGLECADAQDSSMTIGGERVGYGVLFNAAGQHADRVAHLFGAGTDYMLLPFKGIYYHLRADSGIRCNGLIYPVPDLNVPFLGVHFTRKIDGDVFLGPTAIPAFGRENYRGLVGLDLRESLQILYRLAQQYALNRQGFRRFSHAEALRFFKGRFVEAARALVPGLRAGHLEASDKVGIRAQLLHVGSHELVTDFVVERRCNTVHVLNAISPAFTSAMSFAKHIVDQKGE